jgi:hypothetical protein
MFSARLLNARTMRRVGSASTESPLLFRRRFVDQHGELGDVVA